MRARFEELAWSRTPMGEVSLRRRVDPVLDVEVYEVKLDDDFLMSSLFTVAEVELARLGLAELGDLPAPGLDVVVGGLGLGFTARAVLDDPRLSSMIVIEALDEVIDWHRRGLLPFARELTSDPRCRLIHADFFGLADSDGGFDPQLPGRRFHAVLLDIDHSPSHVLQPSHEAFYRPDALRRVAAHLEPGGVFALWSNDPPDEGFSRVLSEVFAASRAQVVTFANPLQNRDATNTIYVARRAA